MGFLGLTTKAETRQLVNRAVREVTTSLATTGLYNEKLFGWLNNNQPIFWEDNPNNYVANGYQANGDVYTCINKIITKLAMCPLLPYTVKTENLSKALQFKTLRTQDVAKARLFNIQTKALTETPIPELMALINTPNKSQTYVEWLKQFAGFYLLNGNSYNYYNGLPGSKKYTEMFVLPAPLINIVSGGAFEPVKGYNIFNSINYRNGVPDFPADRVSHIKTFNPNFTVFGAQLYGQAPLRAYISSLVLNRDSRIEQNKQSKNGGVMGMLSPKVGAPSISDPQVKADLKQQISEAKTSEDLIKRIFVSGAPAEWLQFGLSSVDMDLLKAIRFTRTDVANCFDTPIQLLNSEEASTDNNMQWAVKHFIYNAIMPLGRLIEDRLTRDLCAPYEKYGEKVMLMFDYSVLPELADDLKSLADALSAMWWVTPNEKREYMGWGRSVEDNADKLLVPKTLGLMEDISLSEATFNINA